MHHQIKEVIKTLRVIQDGVAVDLSAGERTALGRLLYILYYRIPNMLLDMVPHSGYPHNGGRHTLHLHARSLDAVAFIELWKEALEAPRFNLNEEEQEVRSQLSYISQEILSLRSEARRAGKII